MLVNVTRRCQVHGIGKGSLFGSFGAAARKKEAMKQALKKEKQALATSPQGLAAGHPAVPAGK